MIDKIDIASIPDRVYKLSTIGMEDDVELVVEEDVKYISTQEEYFPFSSINDFILNGDSYILQNEYGEKIVFTLEQFEKIKELI